MVRESFWIASVWRLRVCMASADLLKFFDMIRHATLDEALETFQFPAFLAVALMREHTEVKATIKNKDSDECEEFEIEKGAKTGSIEDPAAGNIVVEHVFGELAEQWESARTGFKLECEHGGGSEALLNMVWSRNCGKNPVMGSSLDSSLGLSSRGLIAAAKTKCDYITHHASPSTANNRR